MQNQEHVKKVGNTYHVMPGYLTFTGKRLNAIQCKQYNDMTDKIESFKEAGYSTINLELERHRLFCILSGSSVQDFQ